MSTRTLPWQFDDVNGKVLTFSAEDQAYRVWDMTNYEPLYSVPGVLALVIGKRRRCLFEFASHARSLDRRRRHHGGQNFARYHASHTCAPRWIRSPQNFVDRGAYAHRSAQRSTCRLHLAPRARRAPSVPRLRSGTLQDGTVLKAFNHLLLRTKKVDFIEQFNEKLLVKQEGENLNIVDVHTHAVVNVSKTQFITPSAFIFLCALRA
jgi:hypothetical protein